MAEKWMKKGKQPVSSVGNKDVNNAEDANNKTKKESTYKTSNIPKGVSRSAYKGRGQARLRPAEALAHEQLLQSMGSCVGKLRSQGFEPIKLLGEGSYAKVYQVRDSKNKLFAVKIISLKQSEGNYLIQFLPRELAVLMILKHEHITKLYQIMRTKKFVFILMELASGGSIADVVNASGEIPEPESRSMFSKVMEAIHYMHSLGVAHRDLKLENILLDANRQPKLTDFSYSIDLKKVDIDPKTGHTTLSSTFCGTPPYLPPEILSGIPYDAKAGDIWSIGVCLYIMLNNALPFKYGQDKEGTKNMIRLQLGRIWTIKPRVVNKVSEDVKDLLFKMFDPNPQLRATSTVVIRHKWLTGDRNKANSAYNKNNNK